MAEGTGKKIVKVGIGAGLGYLIYRLISGFGGSGFGLNDAAAKADERPLELLIRARDGVTSQTELLLAGQIMTIDQVIARVRSGGRDDVDLLAAGDARHGDVDAAMKALATAGIKIWNREAQGAG